MIKSIIFDLGGVLINLNIRSIQKEMARLGADPEQFFVKTGHCCESTVCDGISIGKALEDYQLGTMTTDDFISFVQAQCKRGTTRQMVVDAWNSCLLDLPVERLNMIKKLRNKGYSTFLLSNTNDLHWTYSLKWDFSSDGYTCRDLFDKVFLSHEVHMCKPDPDIYHMVLEEIGRPASECMFIDDAIPNVKAAAKEGIMAEWLDLSKEDITGLIGRTIRI